MPTRPQPSAGWPGAPPTAAPRRPRRSLSTRLLRQTVPAGAGAGPHARSAFLRPASAHQAAPSLRCPAPGMQERQAAAAARPGQGLLRTRRPHRPRAHRGFALPPPARGLPHRPMSPQRGWRLRPIAASVFAALRRADTTARKGGSSARPPATPARQRRRQPGRFRPSHPAPPQPPSPRTGPPPATARAGNVANRAQSQAGAPRCQQGRS